MRIAANDRLESCHAAVQPMHLRTLLLLIMAIFQREIWLVECSTHQHQQHSAIEQSTRTFSDAESARDQASGFHRERTTENGISRSGDGDGLSLNLIAKQASEQDKGRAPTRMAAVPSVETYEKIVPGGSAVRLACPHSVDSRQEQNLDAYHHAIALTRDGGQRAAQNSMVDSARGFAAADGKIREKLFGPATSDSPVGPAHDNGHEQIRWFKNHIPLSLDLGLDDQGLQTSGNVNQWVWGELNFESTSEQNPSNTSISNESLSTTRTKYNEISRATRNNAVPYDGRNCFISKRGELVILRMDAKSAGSYTCLHNGRQSEVLLDILPDEGEADRGTRPGYRSKKDHIDQDTHQSGHEIVEGPKSSTTMTNERRFRRLVSSKGSRPDNDFGLNQLNSIMPSFPEKTWNGQNNYRAKFFTGTATRDEGLTTSFDQSKDQSKPVHLNLNGFDQLNQPQLHFSESEIILNQDLNSIPGLLYTKQRFHCPLLSRTDLWAAIENQRFQLVENLCRPARVTQMKGELGLECRTLAQRFVDRLWFIDRDCNANNDEDTGDGRTNEILARDPDFPCSEGSEVEKLADFVWYKDGSRLEFDPNGRGLDKRLNLKLIDFMEQSESTLQGPSDNSDSASSRKSSGQNSSSLLPTSSNFNNLQATDKTIVSHGILCPPKGLILEIDGVRQINAGRYSCALKFNASKLRTSFERLKRFRGSAWLGSACSIGMNDKSKCCDADNGERSNLHRPLPMAGIDTTLETPEKIPSDLQSETLFERESAAKIRAQSARFAQRFAPKDNFNLLAASLDDGATKEDPARTDANPDRLGEDGDMEIGSVRRADEASHKRQDEHPWDWERIKALRSILNGSAVPREVLWANIEQIISIQKPLVIAQTFLLLITERPANSCSLWSTICQANDAYSRRKLTDFKRLKRSLMKPPDDTRVMGAVASDGGGGHDLEESSAGNPRPGGGDSRGSDPEWDLNRYDNRESGGRRRRRAIHPNGGGGGRHRRHIDGKLVASLSWLNGALVSGAEKPGEPLDAGRLLAANRRQGRPNPNGQQIFGSMNTNAGEVQPTTIGIRHHDGNALNWMADGRGEPANGPAETWQTGANLAQPLWRHSSETFPVYQSTETTNNASKQAAAKVLAARDLGPVELAVTTAVAAAAQHDENNGNENLFNYANEQNLNLPATPAERRRAFSQWTIVESFDLHPETSDPDRIERHDRSRHHHSDGASDEVGGGELEAAEMDTLGVARDGIERVPHLALRSQGIDIDEGPSGLSGLEAVHHDDDDEREPNSRRRRRRRRQGRRGRGQNRRSGANLDGDHVGRLASGVIDGKRATSKTEDAEDDGGNGPNESSASNEAPDEVNRLELNERADFGQVRRFARPSERDEREGQTNSLVRSLSGLSAATAAAVEFVTEKSNILGGAAGQENGSKSNKSATARTDYLPMAVATPAQAASRRFGGDDLINSPSSPRTENRHEQLQLGPRTDQSAGARRRTRIGLSSDADDARSIGPGGGPLQEPHGGSPGQEDGHKLLWPEGSIEERNRLSPGDKSAPSHGPTRDLRGRSKRQALGIQFGASSGATTSSEEAPPESDDLRQFNTPLSLAETSDQLDDELGQLTGTAPMPRQIIITSPGASEQVPGTESPSWSIGSRAVIEDDTKSDTSPIRASNFPDSLSNTNANANQNDESLLWMASQYLYMHMRAFAASSLYGVQVDVEWSNENEGPSWTSENLTTEIDPGKRKGPAVIGDNAFSSPASGGGKRARLTLKINQLAPIATIELVHGQDLHLQCTAQALGRLPKVDWYKRVDVVPGHISVATRKRLARNVGQSTFWPVTSIDLLDTGWPEPGGRQTGNFASSQSLTIFDNLLNQTFTVVNSLALSQRIRDNRPEESSQNQGEGRHQELYACMVNADVRHEFATLGVNIRHASSKMPPGLSKRLRARSLSNALPVVSPTQARTTLATSDGFEIQLDGPREHLNYNHLRQHNLMMPYGGIRIPIRNNMSDHSDELEANSLFGSIFNSNENSINIKTLCLVIASMSSLLIALVYFTVRSYRILSEFNQEDECLDCMDNLHLPEDTTNKPNVSPAPDLRQINLYCYPDSGLMQYACQQEGAPSLNPQDGWPPCSRDFDHSRTMIGLTNKSKTPERLYEAHTHNLDGHFGCELLDDMIAPDMKEELGLEFMKDFRQFRGLPDSRTTVSSSGYIMWCDNARNGLNMTADPLDEL